MRKKGERRKAFRGRVAAPFVSGLLVLIPLGITLFVLSVFFKATVGVSASFLTLFLGDLPQSLLVLIAAAVCVGGIYVAGFLASHVIGRKVIALGESLVAQIPVVKTIYASSKQVIALFQRQPDTKNQQVVLVDFPAPGLKAIGFLTGHISMPDGTKCYKVFIPTTPNPTTGYFQILPASSCDVLDMSTEEAFRVIMSAGFLAPPVLRVVGSSAVTDPPAEDGRISPDQ